ncbi:MAG: hypothetical protein JSV86_17590 [Gemmatimonadota bacterium]|nr:MAG: hypothetical protein JSV86_17590 [Gemmatimonadota bacterium]
MMSLRNVCVVVKMVALLPAVGLAQVTDAGIPSPAAVLGFEVGSDRRLADWEEITGYMNALAEASDRVLLDTLGTTTLGRPFVALTISSAANLRRLDRYREIQGKLADPRRVESELEAEQLIREGRTVVLITGGIHSTEVGGYQMPMRLAHQLASGEDEDTRAILDNVILLLVPSLNPDGSQMVVDWYEGTLGEPWEGAGPPFLYHHYVGHDDNRDWYAFTQKETRLTVSKLHNVWHPQIVHDLHQMGSDGARFFVPPWTDPIEPNVDPLLIAGINAIGTAMAWEMYGQGKTGIIVNAIFDAWTPARAYQHYHGGVRILTETASARLGTPVTVPFDSLGSGRGVDARTPSWRFPEPWPGGDWHLSDIVDYMEAGATALLKQAALYREHWLSNFYQVGLRSIAGREGWPRAFLIPAEAQNADGLGDLLRILVTGGVEVRRAAEVFVVGGRRYAEGTYVVPMAQPYSGFAKTLLEAQEYPEVREFPGGPLRTPYDATAHTLPLMMGVEVVALDELPDVELSGPIEVPSYDKAVPGLSGGRAPRLAIYEPWVPSMDAGWTRWVFDEYGIAYEQLRDADARAGNLGARFGAIILPDIRPEEMIEGHQEGEMPPEYVGGLGEEGVRALEQFVRAGGTLITFNRASLLPIEQFTLPVMNVLADLDRSEFYIPGSILRLQLMRGHPLAEGMPTRTTAWFERGLAFEPAEEGGANVDIVGRYGEDPLLLSGWLNGAEHIAGHGAIAVVQHGRGRVVLFGFKPQYRGQTIATYPLIFNALRSLAE